MEKKLTSVREMILITVEMIIFIRKFKREKFFDMLNDIYYRLLLYSLGHPTFYDKPVT